MGSSSSRIARTATKSRKYPTKPTLPSSSVSAPKHTIITSTTTTTPLSSSSEATSTASNNEDTKFTTSLRNLGPVDPSLSSPLPPPLLPSQQQQQHHFPPSTSSPSSSSLSSSSFHANNPALRILAARERIAADAQVQAVAEGGGNGGRREYLPVGVLRMVLGMRDDRGVEGEEIEKGLGLKRGLVERLGGKGVVGLVGGDEGRDGG